MAESQRVVPPVGKKVHLKDYAPDAVGNMNKKQGEAELAKLVQRLDNLQDIFYAQQKHALLIVLQGMDTSGKDGTVRKVFGTVEPLGIQLTGFKAPSEEELAHDFLWRVHRKTPPKGYMGIFNRSHYEDVLVVRVNKLVPDNVWQKRYEDINAFEKMLTDNGTVILKFFLHISKAEQKERLQARLDDPTKHWKFSIGDLAVREKWDDYMQAYEDVLTKCNTDYAPWYIVPADKKWYRNIVVAQAIVEALEKLDLKYPEAEPDLDKIVIPD